MRYKGKHWWADYSKVAEYKIKEAVIINDKEITIDYEYEGRTRVAKLYSDDGIHFEGEYGTARNMIGRCEFDLYRNKKGDILLFGGYSSPEDESGQWWIELKPQTKERNSREIRKSKIS